jgi:hypothetical protein
MAVARSSSAAVSPFGEPTTAELALGGSCSGHDNDAAGLLAGTTACAHGHGHTSSLTEPTWSGLPSAGLRSCSSLQRLRLQLSGAPPSPADLEDLSGLPCLSHLSICQLDIQEAHAGSGLECCSGSWGSGCDGSSSSSVAVEGRWHGCDGVTGDEPMSDGDQSPGHHHDMCDHVINHAVSWEAAAVQGTTAVLAGLHMATSSTSDVDQDTDLAAHLSPAGNNSLGSSSISSNNGVRDRAGRGAAVRASSHAVHPPSSSLQHAGGGSAGVASSGGSGGVTNDTDTVHDQDQSQSQGSGRSTDAVRCSVITPAHVRALTRLRHLSSLELAPQRGEWDAAACAALLQLSSLTGLTRLSITWGDATASAAAAQSGTANVLAPNPGSIAVLQPDLEEAVAAALGPQLPLQHCLASLTGLQELELRGAPVVDVAVLQRLQALVCLHADALRVVDAGVLRPAAAATANATAGGSTAVHATQNEVDAVTDVGRDQGGASVALAQTTWVPLMHLQELHVTHPASDISQLLARARTPQLRALGFVARGPADFARLLGAQRRLTRLHLVLPGDEAWHGIAVVRLPTALPGLTALTLEGGLYLPNSLIVGLGVMDVPLTELCLRCHLAPACLERLQRLTRLQRLSLHHVPSAAASGRRSTVASTSSSDAMMLALPARLLPPQLRDLEMTNGWLMQE